MANTNTSLTVNLTIDESRNKVLFAESDKDFVDVLLSFLTIPLGTVVRLCNKNSSVVCIDNLYKSVEGLSDEYFKAIPCRDMLLRPNYAAELECLDLPVDVEGDTDRVLSYYICSHNCSHELLSPYENALCACGKKMVRKVKVARRRKKGERYEGVFLKGATRFVITDDFTVTPLSTRVVSDTLGNAGTTSMRTVVEKQVRVGLPQIIAILRQSLNSEGTLTKVFLGRETDNSLAKKNSSFALVPCPKPRSDPTVLDNTVSIKLIVDKHENKFLFAECKQNFINILFSFLTYPAGFVVESLKGKSRTCLDNLFASALSNSMSDCFKTDEVKKYVINPRLPSYFRSTESLIKSDEATPTKYYMCRTPGCDSTHVSLVGNANCKCKKITNKRMKINDPRRSDANGSILNQGIMSDAMYIVTDDLVVTPFCLISAVAHIIANCKEGILEIPVTIGEKEILALMEASLGSQTLFTDAFLAEEKSTVNSISGVDGDCVLV